MYNADHQQAYVARIQEVNCTLHMVTQLNPDAWQIAMQLDIERMTGKSRGCVPYWFSASMQLADKIQQASSWSSHPDQGQRGH